MQVSEDGQDIYWDEFLGDYAGKNYGEDRIFATTMAINALIDTWADPIPGTNKLQWHPTCSDNVKDIVDRGIEYLYEHADIHEKGHLRNCFFSGSVKTFTSMPWFYPSNVHIFYNGTNVDP